MEHKELKNKTKNIFERNQKKTIILFTFFIFVLLDFSVLPIYNFFSNRNNQNEVSLEKTYRIPSNIYHHDLLKNANIKNASWGNRKYQIFTNNFGFKCGLDNEVISLNSSKNRILFIGDSFTEGIGIEFRNTFVGIISQTLAKNNIEVLNAAVSSYSPIIYWRKIKYLIENIDLKFNEVIVFIDVSDIRDEALYYSLSKEQTVESQKTTFYERLLSFTQNKTLFLHFSLKFIMKELLWLYFPKTDLTKSAIWPDSSLLSPEYGAKGLTLSTFYMNKLNNLLLSKRIKLKIAVYPWPEQILSNQYDNKHNRFWTNWANQNNITIYDFTSYFFNYDSLNLEFNKKTISNYFIEGDVHWNENGHKLIADKFLEFYLKTK